MRKKEIGQAFIMVLILLGIGALLVVPSLRLTGTSLKSSQVVERQTKGLYAADAAQEYIMWKLLDTEWRNENLSTEDVPYYFAFNVCDVPVSCTVIMRAEEGKGGMTLATDDVIRPTKTVDCEGLGSEIPDDWSGTVTYTIRLEQLSEDNSQGLDAVYDVLPTAFNGSDYVTNSSELRVDGGAWVDFPDPFVDDSFGGQVRLRWPASGYFTEPMRDFAVRQVKEIRFELTHTFKGEDKDRVFYNWVLLKVGDIDTLSGPQAPITVGDGTNPEGGLLEASKTSNPEIIQPGVPTPVEYTITVTNLDDETHQIPEITDYLPPGFTYIGPTSGITTDDPQQSLENINDVDRWVLLWQFSPALSIASGDTLTLIFWAMATREVSGSYYNEFTVVPNVNVPSIFQPDDMTVEWADFNTTYSWNQGAVMVPAYDCWSEGEGIIINANMSLIIGGITITSWQVY